MYTLLEEIAKKTMTGLMTILRIKDLNCNLEFSRESEEKDGKLILKLKNCQERVYLTASIDREVGMKIVIRFYPGGVWWNYLDNAGIFNKEIEKISCSTLLAVGLEKAGLPDNFTYSSEFVTRKVPSLGESFPNFEHVVIHLVNFT